MRAGARFQAKKLWTNGRDSLILYAKKCYNISIPGDEAQLVASPSEWKPRGLNREASQFLDAFPAARCARVVESE
jgi:hypothetical protein